MRITRAAVWGLTVLLAAGAASAQEPKPQPSPESQEPDAEKKPQQQLQIRVLQHPYDLASFYRSSQGNGYGAYGAFGVYGYGPYRSSMDHSDRYPLARYYRAGSPSPTGYSRFWTSGYGYSAGPRLGAPYRRTIGENGDLFLMCPTFLAPVGPLNGLFLEER